jgi:hypothetical protein
MFHGAAMGSRWPSDDGNNLHVGEEQSARLQASMISYPKDITGIKVKR